MDCASSGISGRAGLEPGDGAAARGESARLSGRVQHPEAAPREARPVALYRIYRATAQHGGLPVLLAEVFEDLALPRGIARHSALPMKAEPFAEPNPDQDLAGASDAPGIPMALLIPPWRTELQQKQLLTSHGPRASCSEPLFSSALLSRDGTRRSTPTSNGTWYMMPAAARRWPDAARPGCIVNIVAVVERGMPGVAHTCAARAGVIYLSKTLAVEWAPLGIRVNNVAPGVTATEGMNVYPEERRARPSACKRCAHDAARYS